jgi:ATP-binding protein involved in chromosome partitioning
VPLVGKVPLTMPLREGADAGEPLVAVDQSDPAAQAVRQAARGLVALVPVELPVVGPTASEPEVTLPVSHHAPAGMSLPMAG